MADATLAIYFRPGFSARFLHILTWRQGWAGGTRRQLQKMGTTLPPQPMLHHLRIVNTIQTKASLKALHVCNCKKEMLKENFWPEKLSISIFHSLSLN